MITATPRKLDVNVEASSSFYTRSQVTFNGLNMVGLGGIASVSSRDRLVVRTLRCGRSNPGSNPGHGSDTFVLNLKVGVATSMRHSVFHSMVSKRQWYSGEHSCLPSS